MKIWDNVILTSEIDNLSKKGIHKGIDGTVVSINGEICTVWFSNPKNYGEYAFAKIDVKFLQLGTPIPYTKKMLAEMESFIKNVDMEKHVSLTECDVEELDVVELIVEDGKYARHGIHKGDRGSVISTYAIDNHWEIIFSERGTGKDIAQIGVDRKDFIIIDKF
ncbi:MAG: hypothetical protein IJC87_02195 [Clostridia bacterium]|nr:hypothetical protein [Clostridia bacterium]